MTRHADTRARRCSPLQRAAIQALEQRRLLAADPIITEFMAKTGVTLTDGFGDNADWIEITNQGDAAIDLIGWHLTDNNNLAKWTFPSFVINPGEAKVVFASSRDTVDPAGNLHTNFSLSQDGEKLALTRPDLSIASRYRADGSDFPEQLGDVSYGIGTIYDNTTLVGPNSPGRVFVPFNGALDNGIWTTPSFNDLSWLATTGSIGFDTGGYEENVLPPAIVGHWTADSLGSSLVNGATVNTWVDTVGGTTAFRSGFPIYRTNEINGHSVVRFDPSNGNDLLRIPAVSNPMAGNEDFTIIVVFRATGGIGSSGGQWTANAGLVDGSVNGITTDWGISLSSTSGGRVVAGIGSPDRTVASSNNKVDGNPHVAVFTRKDNQISLYVDGGDPVSTTGSATARGLTDMVFGALQTGNNFFTGDIAEVRIYGSAMSTVGAYATSQALGTKYNISIAAPTNALNATLTGHWTADSLNALADGAAVTSWSSSVGSRTANASGSPRLEKNELNGHSVVRFTPSDGNDNFSVSTAQNPLANVADFSVAVVFRTNTPGVGEQTHWYHNSGIVDGEVGGVTNDWGIAIDSAGRIAGGIGNPDTTVYSSTGNANGVAHIVIYIKVGDKFWISVDGSEPYEGAASVANRVSNTLVFGSLRTNLNYFTGDIAEIQTYSGGLDDDARRALAGSLADKYGIAIAPDRYDPYIATQIESQMYNTATTALLRIPFTVSNPAEFDKLSLRMQYDDGFVAYLNGVEIVRRNASGTITYTSVADTRRLDNDALTIERIDVSAFRHLLLGSGQTNILAIRALNSDISDPDLLLIPQLIASKTTIGEAYMSEPTPGAPNGEGFIGFVPNISFSHPHGVFDNAFNVTVNTSMPGVTLVYTLDGSEPSMTNGTVVSPASSSSLNSFSINVNQTRTLRVIGFRNLYLPSRVATQTYILKSSVLTQSNVQPVGAYWDTEVDPHVVNMPQTYSVSQALSAIPTMSLVLDHEAMFGNTGIYKNPRQKGRQWERETSVEYFDPNDPSLKFQIDAGVRIQGGSSRDPSRPKKSFRLYFRTEYGEGKLEQPLFGTDYASQEFDKITLRAGNNYSWPNETHPLTDYMRDEWARQVAAEMNGFGAAGKFVHLYINGLYWGVYNVVEEPDEQWAANQFGGEKENYDLLEPDGAGGIEVKEGTGDAYYELFNTTEAAFISGGIDNAEYAAISELVDMNALVNYILSTQFRGDRDAPVLISNNIDPRNFYAFHRNDIPNGKVIFQVWDGELSMDDVNIDRTEIIGNLNPARLFYQLRSNAEFRQFVADRIYAVYYNGGVFDAFGSVNKPLERYDNLVAQLNIAIVGESARWGDSKRSLPYTRDVDWMYAVNWMRNTYFAQRPTVALNQARNDFPAAQRLPAAFLVDGQQSRGGNVGVGAVLTLVNQNVVPGGDAIYYTDDGTDPRLPGGGVSPTAIPYTGGNIVLNATQTITVRTFNGGSWSPIDRAAFIIAANGLRLTEIAYQPTVPPGGTFSAGEYEFVELQNTGSTALNIGGTAFTLGITATIPADTILQPGEYAVLVKNIAAFQQRYGTSPRILTTFSGSLANEGETLTLIDGSGNTIHSFAYANNWYPVASGGGHSLVIRDALADKSAWATAAGWRPSQLVGGSPSGIDVDLAPTVVIVPITPNPRNTTVNAITIAFDEPVTGFDLGDLSLSRDGSVNLLTGGQSLSSADGGKTWTISNLATLMSVDGTFTLSLTNGGIVDLTSHPLVGGATASFVLDRVAPTITNTQFLLDGAAPQLRYTLSESLTAGSSTPVLIVTPAGGGASVAVNGYVIAGSTITFDLPTTLATANYTATLSTPGVRDAAGNETAAGSPFAFGFLAGDINRDGTVGFDDLLILAQNYGNSGRSYTQGNVDFSSDGRVEFSDLLILAQQYGKSLPTAVELTPEKKKPAHERPTTGVLR